MSKRVVLGVAALSLWAANAAAQTCATYPNILTNGTTADANQVMANFNCAALLGGTNFTGNVGVDASTPRTPIDLGISLQTIKLAVYSDTNAWETYGIGIAPSEMTFGAAITPTGTPQMVLTSGGRLGINTTAPTTPIDLSLSIQTIKLALYEDGTPSNTYGIGVNSGELTFGTAITPTGTPEMVLTAAGYLGVGTTSPGYPLYVNGTAYAAGAAGALSDIRHKDKVRTMPPGALDIVERLRPVTFVWKDPKDDGMRGEQIGFIAQEIQKTLPDVVLVEKNVEKTMGIKYTEIIPVLAAAIQEQQTEIAALKAEVAALKAR